MRRFVAFFGFLGVVAGIALPVVVAIRQQQRMRHFHVVREGILYRSAQLTVDGIRQAIHDHGIRTIVNLRDGTTALDQAEEAFCNQHGVGFVRIAPLGWDGVKGTAPVDRGLLRFLEVLRDPANHPVLVHCYRGVHRTGGYVAVYRMEFENWTNDRAIEEMRALGYIQFDEHLDVRGYLTSYRPSGRYRLSPVSLSGGWDGRGPRGY